MTDRITRHTMYREMLQTLERRSTCPRSHVAALLVRDERVISMGYNGSPPGAPHCLDVGCLEGIDGGCLRTVHAEANAIAFAARYGIATAGAVLYTSIAPCLNCAKLIASAGITHVLFLKPYRLTDGERLLVEGYGNQCLQLVA